MKKLYKDDFLNTEIIKRIEKLERTPKIDKEIKPATTTSKASKTSPINIKTIIMVILALIAISRGYYLLVIILFVFFIKLNNKNTDNGAYEDSPYANSVVLPILDEVFPGTKLCYNEGIDEEVYDRLFPRSEKYYSDCHISFADEYNTEFSNLSAYHSRRSSKGKYIEINDFYGQVFLIKLKTNIKGHIRIVPLNNGNEDDEFFTPYGKRKADEREIITESIYFNQAYNIFATDEFYTKYILDPSFIELLNDWSKKMKVCIYINENLIAVSFDSKTHLFTEPSTNTKLESISLVDEYEKVREKFGIFYEFINIIREKV